MTILTVVAVCLSIAHTCLSEDGAKLSKPFSGLWYANKYKATTNTDDVYTCYYGIEEIMDDTTIQSSLSFEKNGQPYKMVYNLTLKRVEGNNGEHFIMKELIYSHHQQQQICTFHLRVTKNKNVFIKSLCKDPPSGVTDWCMSRYPNSSDEIVKECPNSEGFKDVDNSDC